MDITLLNQLRNNLKNYYNDFEGDEKKTNRLIKRNTLVMEDGKVTSRKYLRDNRNTAYEQTSSIKDRKLSVIDFDHPSIRENLNLLKEFNVTF